MYNTITQTWKPIPEYEGYYEINTLRQFRR